MVCLLYIIFFCLNSITYYSLPLFSNLLQKPKLFYGQDWSNKSMTQVLKEFDFICLKHGLAVFKSWTRWFCHLVGAFTILYYLRSD